MLRIFIGWDSRFPEPADVLRYSLLKHSSIPLDMFLKNVGTATQAVKDAFRNIYAPNVLAYAACGLKAFPATVTATNATGHCQARCQNRQVPAHGICSVSSMAFAHKSARFASRHE